MKKCWYTCFLAVSLAASALWTGGSRIYERYENAFAAESVQEAESRQNAGSQPEEEPDTEAAPDIELDMETAPDIEAAPTPLFPGDFAGVLFIGDSRTVGLKEYGDLGQAEVFADTGMSVFNLWSSEVPGKDGRKRSLQQVLSEGEYHTIHVMLGINELGYSMEQIIKKYRGTAEEIQRMQPQAVIVLGGNLHITREKSERSDIYKNEKINELNGYIKQIAEELNCRYMDINEKFDDSQGGLAKEYTSDGSHVLGKYYTDWVQWLRERQ